ncbi:kinesin-like protein KIF2A isoform X2 [Bemisia tabaci]|uniref:kinesin-like protein KIF2A isoform X2 n=1 Tax=Bemisia tabaci TaxID=7038 RepID=UPI003B285132
MLQVCFGCCSSPKSLKTDQDDVAADAIRDDVKKDAPAADPPASPPKPKPPTSGRVHSAIVSGVNPDTRSVTVEWFEKGETKGKEIEVETILALNGHLAAPNNINNFNVPNNKVPRYSTNKATPAPVVSNKGSYRSTKLQSRPTNIITNGHSETRGTENLPSTPTTPVVPSRETFISSHIPGAQNVRGSVTSSLANATTINVQQRQQQQKQQQQQQQELQQQDSQGGKNRRSHVVKEVEKLKKNREERRQRQAELREEKEALINMDPGQQNWEFLGMIRDYRSQINFRPLRDAEPVENHQISVCVRKRPLNKKELARKEVDVITVPTKDQIVVHEPKNKVDLTKYLENQLFRFDYAFDDSCDNDLVYKFTAKPLVETIFEGGMATCFAYGQTGSGKTHTMGGDFQGKTQDCKKGIYAMAAKDVFKWLRSPKYKPLNLIVSASFFEIYSGKVFDLLADKAKLRVLEDGKQQVQIVGLTERIVENVDDVLKLIQHGNSARTSGQTSANSNSSRSHAVFQIIVRNPGVSRIHGKFSLIDLAGNERGADTSSANRQTRMEGAEINKSLLALKECIRALGRKGAHLPFRASKLTQVLKDSFIGEKSKTCMIAMISPGMSSCEHSLNTLRYADRVKELAATDPAADKNSSPTLDLSPQRNNVSNHHDNSAMIENGDLAALRSLNEGEISAELYTFHEAVSQLQLQEDEMLDMHKALLEQSKNWQQRDIALFSMTRDVDYDQDAFSKELQDLVVEKRNFLDEFYSKIVAFRQQLIEEEKISKNMSSNTPHRFYN